MKQYATYFILCVFIGISACTLPVKTPTPTAVITISPSSTPTVEPSPTPTYQAATLPPGSIVLPVNYQSDGEKAIFNGDYSTARKKFQEDLNSNSDVFVRSAAMWGIGKTDYLSQDYPAALVSLRNVIELYPGTEFEPRAWFLLGETYYFLERYKESADAFQHYLDQNPGLLDRYLHEKRGDALALHGEYENAQNAYLAAINAADQADDITLKIKIANMQFELGDAEGALKLYDEIYSTTQSDNIKAQMDRLSGAALLAMGQIENGYGRWRHAVDTYQDSYESYSALVGLVEAGQPVDEFNRGLVDYYAQKYDVALRAFQLFQEKNPNHDGTVIHYMALTLREMGDYNSAINLWDILITQYPGNRYWASAWDEKAVTLWYYLEEYETAANTLELFVDQASASSFASTYLFEAARIYERAGNLEKAAELWESLPEKFPDSMSIDISWFQAGLARYRTGNFPAALRNFQQTLLFSKTPPDRARALLWTGKAYERINDIQNARSAWEQASTTDPNGYYSIRASDLLDNRKPFSEPVFSNLNFDLTSEKKEAASWVRIKFNLPAGTNLETLDHLQSDLRLRRGVEFWTLGLYDYARIEFEALRDAVKIDPADSFRLGNFLLEIGAYRSGIYALREVLNIAGMNDQTSSLTAPIYFTHARYGLYFADLVWPLAEEIEMDPIFVTSIIRQESLFEGFVKSDKGARGLMQIMPATGVSIADQIGWPQDFHPDDLYRPLISIRMGTHYLKKNLEYLSNDPYAMLAGYNSGPGNAYIWQQLANGDLDLELEIIRFGETRDYIRSIYEIYTVFRNSYGPIQ